MTPRALELMRQQRETVPALFHNGKPVA
jgi:hypothetical protein